MRFPGYTTNGPEQRGSQYSHQVGIEESRDGLGQSQAGSASADPADMFFLGLGLPWDLIAWAGGLNRWSKTTRFVSTVAYLKK